MVTLRWEGNTLLFKSFVAGWKTVCGACKRAVCLCFLGCAGRHTLLTELSAAGLLGVAVDKVTRCVAIPALLAVWEWRRQAGVSCAAKSSVSSLLCKKGLLYMGFAQYSSPFCILDPLSHRSALPISSKKNFDSISQRMKKLSMMGCFFGAAAAVFLCVPPVKKQLSQARRLVWSAKLKCNSLNYAQSEAERI